MLIKQMVKKDNTPMTHIIFNFLSSVFVILPIPFTDDWEQVISSCL